MNRSMLKVTRIAIRIFIPVVILTVVYLPVSSYVPIQGLPQPVQKIVQNLEPQQAQAALDTRVYLLYSDSVAMSNLWSVPNDWNSASNSIEVIGGGGSGGDSAAASRAGGGGGGGYSKISNLALTPGGSAYFSVGASGSAPSGTSAKGGNGGHTWFGTSSNTTFAQCFSTGITGCVSAEGGEGGSGADGHNAGAWGDGGNTASVSGTTTFAGGNGGTSSGTTDGSTGGGGAAGPGGIGKAGGTVSSSGGSGGGGSGGGSSTAGTNNTGINGTAGGNGYSGAAGGTGATSSVAAGVGTVPGAGGGGGANTTNLVGADGAIGQEWDSTHGSGGGGGGAGDSGTSGGSGGLYGGGGGGGITCNGNDNCRGANGLIVITYRAITEITPTAVGTQTASINIPASTTNTYIGGAFKLTTTSTTTVTSIAVTASTSTGTVTGLDDVKLYWDTAASCNTANPITSSTLYNTASANFSTMKATISGSTAVTAGTPKCFYPAMDVTSTVTEGLRFDIKIEALTDIVTAITEVGTYPVAINGVSVFSTPAAADLSWDTGAADFEIWAGATSTSDASLAWDNGTLICSTSLTDDNSRQSTCGTIRKNQKYRVQTILKNVGGTAANMNGAADPVDQKNVKTFWAGTSPTLDTCGFNDIGADNGATTCTLAFNGNDVRITNTGVGNVVIAVTTGSEGFMYLITTGSDVPSSDSSTYMYVSIDSITEDSSRVSIGLLKRPGVYIRGGVTIRGRVKFR